MEPQDFKIDGLINIGKLVDNDDDLWERLIDHIMGGNVIPVIGPDMLIDNKENLHQVIIDLLAKALKLNSRYSSFSELVFDGDFIKRTKNRQDKIYSFVNQIFSNPQLFHPSIRLKKLLETHEFPFVITTSFTPVVENCMREVWGNSLQVKRFNNNPSENDDIISKEDLRKPTVYYMFGKVGVGAGKYVLTDTDMLNFVSSWLSETRRPRVLSGELKNKYLLMLGTDYANWLFRFIWYSMRMGADRQVTTGQEMLAYDAALDQSLINFLERTQTFTKQDTSEVVNQLVDRLSSKKEQERTKFDRPEDNMDIFISYSRSDADVATELYTSLTAKGIKVWYDKKNLTDGGKFMDEIRHAIGTSKYFVPILSNNITKETNEQHVYRKEWNCALDVDEGFGRTYIIPLAEEGFDFYKASIPEKLQRHNAIFFERNSDIDTIAEKIINKMNQL